MSERALSVIAAIYARKSTEQSVADEQKSVARQVEHARTYAACKGWTVDEACIFVDDGISGAEFANRPGYVRLMTSVKPRPTFQVLLMSESSRLGREAWETGYALKQLLTAGVRVFFYLEDRECSFDHPMDKLQFSIVQAFDEMERTRASQRSTDKALQLARAGHVTGGRVFGYDNVRIDSHTERRINERETAAVRRIFELAAAGVGQKRIGLQLNADGIAAPRAQQGRPAGWTQSSVHEVLFRELYRGEIVWNRTKKRNAWGEKRVSDRPAEHVVRVPAEQLRIVSEELWTSAHRRIAEARAQYRDATKGLRGGRPRIESKYLLPGFARCACCQAGLFVSSANHGSRGRRRRMFTYGCTAHHNKGRTVCTNGLRAPMDVADAAVLGSIGEVLTSDLVDDVLGRVRELLEAPVDTAADVRRRQLEAELAAAAAEVVNLTEAIALGGNLASLVRRLQDAERTRQAAAAALEELGTPKPLPRIDWRAVEAAARRKLADWRALLTRQVAQGRELLRAILVGPIRFTPFEENGRRGYRFAGCASIGGLLEGLLDCTNGEWRPHREPVSRWGDVPFSGELEVRRAA